MDVIGCQRGERLLKKNRRLKTDIRKYLRELFNKEPEVPSVDQIDSGAVPPAFGLWVYQEHERVRLSEKKKRSSRIKWTFAEMFHQSKSHTDDISVATKAKGHIFTAME